MSVKLQVQVNLKSRELLAIGEVARRSGVAASALRFYEERGLIESVRSGPGHRRYPRSVLRRIAFIVFAQRIGLTLAFLDLSGRDPCAAGSLVRATVTSRAAWRTSKGLRRTVSGTRRTSRPYRLSRETSLN